MKTFSVVLASLAASLASIMSLLWTSKKPQVQPAAPEKEIDLSAWIDGSDEPPLYDNHTCLKAPGRPASTPLPRQGRRKLSYGAWNADSGGGEGADSTNWAERRHHGPLWFTFHLGQVGAGRRFGHKGCWG